MRVAIIGGEKSLVDGNWSRRLTDHGLDVVCHHHDKNRKKMMAIPSSAEGVIIIRDMARHQMTDAAKVEAAKRGIPVAAVPRKWSKAEPILRTQGILPAVTTPSKLPPVKERNELALAYIIEARAEGRIPKQDEVFGAMQRAFGPKCRFGSSEYGRLCSKAAAQQPLGFVDGLLSVADLLGEEPVTPDPFDDAFEWGTTLLAERPDLLLDLPDYRTQVAGLFGESDRPERVFDGADEAAKSLRAKWKKDTGARLAAISVWLKAWWKAWVADPKKVEFPRNTEIHKMCRAIFGSTPRSESMKEARAYALGDWATELIELGAAQQYLDAKMVTLRPRKVMVRTLLEAGDIKGIEVVPKAQKRRGRWYTSEPAIDDYVATVTVAKSEAPVRAPIIEEIAALLAPITEALADIQARLKALEDKPPPTVNVDVGVDLVDINARVKAIGEAVDGLTAKAATPVSMGFGEVVDVVVSAVAERQVELSVRPLPISR